METVLRILRTENKVINAVPSGYKENVCYLVNNSENVIRKQRGKYQNFTDDCGAWGRWSSYRVNFIERGDTLVFVLKIKGIFGKMVNRNFTALEPQPNAKEIVTFIRYYCVLQRDRSYKRRITMLDNVQSSKKSNNAVFEYLGKYPLHTIPHGNARTPGGEYVKTAHTVKTVIVANLAHNKLPRQIYTDLVLEDSKEAPRDLRQVQNIKYAHEKEKQQICLLTTDLRSTEKNNADDIQAMFSAMHDNPFIQLLFQDKHKPPAAVLYTDEQMIDLRNVCQHQNCVLGIDRHTCQPREKFSRDKRWPVERSEAGFGRGVRGSSPGNFKKPVLQMVQSELFLSYMCQYN